VLSRDNRILEGIGKKIGKRKMQKVNRKKKKSRGKQGAPSYLSPCVSPAFCTQVSLKMIL
jgi:hypothetical protein